MSPRKNIFAFAALSGLYFSLLTIPWPGPWSGPTPHLMDAYRWAFRAVSNVLFVRMGDGGSVKFSAKSRALHEPDTAFRIQNSRTGRGGSGEIKSMYTGYRPTAFLCALILATPTTWRRRGFALLWGMPLVSAFVALRVWLFLIVMMSNPDAIRAYELSDWLARFVGALNGVFVRSPAVGYIVPALIWMVVVMRRDAWHRFGIQMGVDEDRATMTDSRPGHGKSGRPRAET